MKNIICRLSILLLVILSVGCANKQRADEFHLIGVYEAYKWSCKDNQTEINACKQISLLEFVKGNFYSISNKEVAFVIWSGEVSDELLYTARKYEEKIFIDKFPIEVSLSSDPDYVETITFDGSGTGLYTYGKKGEVSKIHIRRLKENEIGEFKKTYPGGD